MRSSRRARDRDRDRVHINISADTWTMLVQKRLEWKKKTGRYMSYDALIRELLVGRKGAEGKEV